LPDANIYSPSYKTPTTTQAPLASKEDISRLEWNVFDGYFVPTGSDVQNYVLERKGRDKCRETCQDRKDCVAFAVRKSDGLCSLKTEFSLKEDKDWLTEHKQFLRNISDNFFASAGLTVRRKKDLETLTSQHKGSLMISTDYFREAVAGDDITKSLGTLTEVEGDLVINNLPSNINHLKFLSNLTSVGGVLEISNNDYLCSIDLPALQHVGDILTVTMNNNPCLQALGTIGIPAGVWVGNLLQISHNGHLSSSSVKAVVNKITNINPEVEVYVDEIGISL